MARNLQLAFLFVATTCCGERNPKPEKYLLEVRLRPPPISCLEESDAFTQTCTDGAGVVWRCRDGSNPLAGPSKTECIAISELPREAR